MAIAFYLKMIFSFLITRFPCPGFPHPSPSPTPSVRTSAMGHPPAGYASPSPSRAAPCLLLLGESPAPGGSNFPPDDSERLRLTPQHPGKPPTGKPPHHPPPSPGGQGGCSSLCSSLLSRPMPAPSWQAAWAGGKGEERLFRMLNKQKKLWYQLSTASPGSKGKTLL